MGFFQTPCWAFVGCFSIVACSVAGFPTAPVAKASLGEAIPVSSMPPPALSEEVPPQPNDEVVWADGCWEPSASNWVWLRGGWVVAPQGASLFRGQLAVARDGALWWQPCTWIAAGKAIGWISPTVPAAFPLTDRTIYSAPS